MTPSPETQAAASAPIRASDRPPVGRFFALFGAMLALALGLAMLSEVGAATDDTTESREEARAEAPPHSR